jgi:hypothetical protein
MLKLLPFWDHAIKGVAANVEEPVRTRPEVLLSRVRRELNELFLGEMAAKLGIQFIANVGGRVGQRIRHAEQRLLRRGELIEVAGQQSADFIVTESEHSAAGRIDVNSKWAPDTRGCS